MEGVVRAYTGGVTYPNVDKGGLSCHNERIRVGV